MKIIITEKKTQIINRKHKNNIIPEAKESDGAIYEIEIFQSVCRITINVGPHAEYGRLHRLYVSFFASYPSIISMRCRVCVNMLRWQWSISRFDYQHITRQFENFYAVSLLSIQFLPHFNEPQPL